MYTYYFEGRHDGRGKAVIKLLEPNERVVCYYSSEDEKVMYIRRANDSDPEAIIRVVDKRHQVELNCGLAFKSRRFRVGYDDGVVVLHFIDEPG